MIYRLYKTSGSIDVNAAMTIDATPSKSFLFDPANNDYQQFKKDIENGVELQDSEGNPMSQEAAIEFVRGLP